MSSFPGRITRRSLIKSAAALVAAPSIVPASVLRGDTAPSNRVNVGIIGGGHSGSMGTMNMRSFLDLNHPNDVQARVLAVCDVHRGYARQARDIVNEHYSNSDCAMYADFRELLDRPDIDAVSIAVPDHWHAIISIAAAQAGKDIYGEKPLSKTLREGRAMVNAVQRYGRIWQTGSWQRAQGNFRHACELVRNGRLGKIHTIEVGLPVDGKVRQVVPVKGVDPPEELDWPMWLGPAPDAPYQQDRMLFHWRWILDYGGGSLMDWIGHHVDIAHWGMDWDHTGPREVQATGEFQREGLFNTAGRYHAICKYPDDVTMHIYGNQRGKRTGTKWIGDQGWVWVDRGRIDAHPKRLLNEVFSPDEVHLPRSPGHVREFVQSVLSRRATLTPVEVAHRSATPGHLAHIAMVLGRKLRFDPATERILNDETATRLTHYAYRAPWTL